MEVVPSLGQIVTMHVDNPLGLSLMPHSHGERWLLVDIAFGSLLQALLLLDSGSACLLLPRAAALWAFCCALRLGSLAQQQPSVASWAYGP